MQELCNGLWREIAHGIRQHLSADAFHRWFAAIELVGADEFALTLQVPNSIYQFWIESNYLNVVESVATSVLGSHREIKFSGADSAMTGAAVSSPDKVSETPSPRSQDENSADALNHGMNPRNRFETFVALQSWRGCDQVACIGGDQTVEPFDAGWERAAHRRSRDTGKALNASSNPFTDWVVTGLQRGSQE